MVKKGAEETREVEARRRDGEMSGVERRLKSFWESDQHSASKCCHPNSLSHTTQLNVLTLCPMNPPPTALPHSSLASSGIPLLFFSL